VVLQPTALVLTQVTISVTAAVQVPEAVLTASIVAILVISMGQNETRGLVGYIPPDFTPPQTEGYLGGAVYVGGMMSCRGR
jgi:hypothetical protein